MNRVRGDSWGLDGVLGPCHVSLWSGWAITIPCFFQSIWILSFLNQSLGQYRDNQHLNMSCSSGNFLLEHWQLLSFSFLFTDKTLDRVAYHNFPMSVLPIFMSNCNLISVLTIWWFPCVVFSCVVGGGCLLWPVHFLGKTLLVFALLHSVFQGQIYLLLQVFLDFLLCIREEME